MKRKERPIRVLSLVCSLVFFLNIIQFGVFRTFPIFQVSVLFLTIFVFSFGRVYFNQLLLVLFSVVLLSSVVAFLVSFNPYNFLAYSFFCFSAFIVYAAGAKHDEENDGFFLRSFIFLSFLFSLFSFYSGFSLYRFSGLFDNPNGMGRFAAWTTLVCLLYLFVAPRFWKTKFIIFLSIILFLLSVVFLLASNSRLSIGSLGISVFSVFSLAGVRQLLLLKLKKSSVYKLFFCFLFLFFCFFVFYKIGLFDSLVYKFLATSERGDFSQGRFSRWSDAIPYLSWFGRGHEIYKNATVSEVHSNYIGQVLVYGWVPTLTIYFVFLYMFFRSFFVFILTGFFGYLLSFGFFVFYFFYGIFETGFAILPVYLAIFFLGFSDRSMKTRVVNVCSL
tara:strand:+ start:537 stop:1703 length:1167 start_codon:yes stop_codon:yes gene_type:complete